MNTEHEPDKGTQSGNGRFHPSGTDYRHLLRTPFAYVLLLYAIVVRVLKVAIDPLKHLLRHLLVVLGWSLAKPEGMLSPATANLSLAIFPSFSRVNDVVTLTYQVLVQSFPVRYRRLAYRTVQHRASLLVNP